MKIKNKSLEEELFKPDSNPETIDKIVKEIKNAGSIFIGKFSPEAIGDYMAGPNHVLPTSGSARFSSGLSVNDFLKRHCKIRNDGTGRKISKKSKWIFKHL